VQNVPGHKAIEGVHYNRIDVYAPVPTWLTIKLQLALTSRHHLQLKAFDCVVAYLQANLKDPLYVYPTKGLMQEFGQDPNKIWMLNNFTDGPHLAGYGLIKYLRGCTIMVFAHLATPVPS